MKVLVVGCGAREHALVWKLTQSKRVSKIYCTPGNAGINELAECIDIKFDDIIALCDFALENEIDLTVVGPIIPLELGIVDKFKEHNLLIFGPNKEAAQIETNKSFAKKIMNKYQIPTASYSIFNKEILAIDFAKKSKYPLVIKYDGKAGNNGLFVCETFEQAKKAIEIGFISLYKAVIIEEFIKGDEVSFQVITDGYTAIPLSPCKKYKKLYTGNTGPNTEGMGCYAPASIIDHKLEQKIAQNIIFPLIDGLNNEGTPFTGVLNTTIIIDKNNNPYVIDLNAKLGDPEAQTILPLLEDDLFEIMYSTAIGSLSDEYEFFNISNSSAITVILASAGYPGTFKKGYPIEGLDQIDDDDVHIFHSGTTIDIDNELVTNGGKVLSITGIASVISRAYEKTYDSVSLIKFKDMRYRKDIAKYQIIPLPN